MFSINILQQEKTRYNEIQQFLDPYKKSWRTVHIFVCINKHTFLH